MPKPFFSHLQWLSSINRSDLKDIPQSLWPAEWRTIHFKTYPRFPRWKLKPGKKLPGNLEDILLNRKSRRDFSPKKVSFEELSDILVWSAGLQPGLRGKRQFFRRMYPSGGGRFPLEIYPLVLRSSLPAGLYHFNVYEESLEQLWPRDFSEDLGQYMINPRQWRKAALILFVTAIFERNQVKYGERGYRVIFKEAGHLGQNVYLVSEALGLKCCAVGGFYDEPVNRLLGVDGSHEAAIYSLVIGK